MGDRLRIGHAITFEARRQHKQIGRCIELLEVDRGNRAAERDAVAKGKFRNLGP